MNLSGIDQFRATGVITEGALAGHDAAELARPGAQDRLEAAARDLLGALGRDRIRAAHSLQIPRTQSGG